MTQPAEVVLAWDEGEVRYSGGSWQWAYERESGVAASLGAALLAIEPKGEGCSGVVRCGIPSAELLAAADRSGVEEILPWFDGGFVKIDGYWFPSAGILDYDGDASAVFEAVASFGDFGWSADLYRYGDIFLFERSLPEGEDRGVIVLGAIGEAEAIAAAEEWIDDEMSEFHLQYPLDGGLTTNDVPDSLPADSRAIRRLTMFDHVGDKVVDLTVYCGVDGACLVAASGAERPLGAHADLDELLAIWESTTADVATDVEIL